MRGDGESKAAAKIQAPDNRYTRHSVSAIVNGKLFIFGGWYGERKKVFSVFLFLKNKIFQIAVLDGCQIIELEVKLNVDRDYGHSALTVENGEKGEFFDF